MSFSLCVRLWRILLLVAYFMSTKGDTVPLFDLEGSGLRGSGDGSGLGSGSGDTINPTVVTPTMPPSCVLPTGNFDPTDKLISSVEDGTLRGQCHAACLEKVLNRSTMSLQSFVKSHDMPWMTVSVNTLREHCDIYNEVHECRIGCEIGLRDNDCVDDCLDNCQSDANGSKINLPESRCLRICDRNICSLGCQVYKEIKIDSNSIPQSPNGVFSLHQYSSPYLHKPGVYALQFTPHSPKPTTDPLVTSFILQIEVEDNTTYYWVTSLQDVVTLGYVMVCKTITVRFLPVNKFGNSNQFSESVSLSVYGDIWPKLSDHPSPYLVQYSMEDDQRIGFWEHAVINITWLPPNNFQYNEGFMINITSPNRKYCGPSSIFSVKKSEHLFTWRAQHPIDGPFGNCTYTMKVLSLPHNKDFPGLPETIPLPVTANNLIPPDYTLILNFTTVRVKQRSIIFSDLFNFTSSWQGPAHPKLIEGIEKFVLRLWKAKLNENGKYNYEELMREAQFKKIVSTNFTHSFESVYSVPTKVFFITELETVYKAGFHKYIKENFTKIFDARPFPPSNVTNFNVPLLTIDKFGELSLEMTLILLDESVSIYVYIGLYPISGDDPTFRSDSVCNISTSDIEDVKFIRRNSIWTLSAKTRANYNILPNDVSTWQLYVQVLAKNNRDRYSHWSHPIIKNISSLKFTNLPQPSSTFSVFANYSSASTGNPTDSDDDKPDTVYHLIPVFGIVPIVLLLLLGILVATVLLLVAYIQNKKLKMESDSFHSPKKALAMSGSNPYWSPEDWEINPSYIGNTIVIGEGTFGEVKKGTVNKTLKGKRNIDTKNVFIKTLRASATDHECKDFCQQLVNYKTVADIEESGHPFLLSLLGCVTTSEPNCIITEFCVHGDLLSYLLQKRQQLEDKVQVYGLTDTVPSPYLEPHGVYSRLDPVTNSLSSEDLIVFAKQIASAMDCLAGLGIVHKDLACRNIYISEGRVLKVADFGVVVHGQREDIYPMELPLRWMALESIVEHTYSTSSDVWAYGVTVWEIITLGEFPYKNVKNEDILSYLMKGDRLQCPENCSPEFFTILQSCWFNDINSRPSFELLHETLLHQLTHNECSHLIRLDIFDNTYEIETPPSQCSNDSAICHSPLPLPETVEVSVECIGNKPTPYPSARNPSYRKDSMDIPAILKMKVPLGPTSSQPAQCSNLDVVPRVQISNPTANLFTTTTMISFQDPPPYDSLPKMAGDGSTEV